MRLEIVIPDSTRPEVKRKLTNLAHRLSVNPEMVEELVPEAAETIPDYLGIIENIRNSPGRFKSAEEVDTYIAELRDEW